MRESLITKICRYKRSHSSSPQTERGKRVLIQFRNINAFLSSDIIAAGELEIKHTRMGGGVLSYSLFINLWWALNPLVTVLHFYKQCLYFVVERWHHEIIRNLFLRFIRLFSFILSFYPLTIFVSGCILAGNIDCVTRSRFVGIWKPHVSRRRVYLPTSIKYFNYHFWNLKSICFSQKFEFYISPSHSRQCWQKLNSVPTFPFKIKMGMISFTSFGRYLGHSNLSNWLPRKAYLEFLFTLRNQAWYTETGNAEFCAELAEQNWGFRKWDVNHEK